MKTLAFIRLLTHNSTGAELLSLSRHGPQSCFGGGDLAVATTDTFSSSCAHPFLTLDLNSFHYPCDSIASLCEEKEMCNGEAHKLLWCHTSRKADQK